jgi:hypothetical protein
MLTLLELVGGLVAGEGDFADNTQQGDQCSTAISYVA